MGSPMLLAHGFGVPVKDAVTTVSLPAAGAYRVWVRTRDWVAPWGASGAPGRFQLLIDGEPLETTFGIGGAAWHWQDGGIVEIKNKRTKLALHDLTGFDGRCDAIVFSSDFEFVPPPKARPWRLSGANCWVCLTRRRMPVSLTWSWSGAASRGLAQPFRPLASAWRSR